jgi:acetyl esterase/lipase
MKKTIWKFPLEITDSQIIIVPACAEILTIQIQKGIPTLWCMVDPTEQKTDKLIIICHGTGHIFPDPDELLYISTVQQESFVWHFFTKE